MYAVDTTGIVPAEAATGTVNAPSVPGPERSHAVQPSGVQTIAFQFAPTILNDSATSPPILEQQPEAAQVRLVLHSPDSVLRCRYAVVVNTRNLVVLFRVRQPMHEMV